jgi:hypothetical protein
VLDIFSCYVVGWRLALREAGGFARRLFAETCAKQEVPPGQVTIPAELGSSVRGQGVTMLLRHPPRARAADRRGSSRHSAHRLRASPGALRASSPQPPRLPTAAWINPPVETTTRLEASGSTISTPDDVWIPPNLALTTPAANNPAHVEAAH